MRSLHGLLLLLAQRQINDQRCAHHGVQNRFFTNLREANELLLCCLERVVVAFPVSRKD